MNQVQKTFISSVALGTCALFMSLLFTYYIPASAAQLSLVFLFIAANTGSISGTFLAAAVALLPQALIAGTYPETSAQILFYTLISFCVRGYPKMPSHVFVFLAWMLLIIPAGFYLHGDDAFMSTLMVRATGDMFLCALSEAILLHTSMWNSLTGRTRVVSNHQALSPIFIAVASGAVLLTLAPLMGKSAAPIAVDHAFMIFVAVSIVPSYISWRLAAYFRNLPEQGILRRQHSAEKDAIDKAIDKLDQEEESTPRPQSSDTLQVRHEEGYCTLNGRNEITHMNKSFRLYAEVRDGDTSQKTLSGICMDPDLRDKLTLLNDHVPRGDQHTSEYGRVRDGRVDRFFRIGVNKRGKDGSSTITLKDISDQRRIESHLLQAQKMKSLGSVVRGLAHSFNNALTSIIGNASIARRAGDLVTCDEALKDIVETANKAGELVWSLLDFAEKKPSLMRNQDLNVLIESHIQLLQNMVGEKYTIEYHPDETPLGILADGNLMTQLLSNLILNASEAYNGKPGKIAVSTATEEMDEQIARLHPGAKPGTFARIKIQDFGSGMSPDVLAKAFDPLFTTKKEAGHSGLGLSTVFAILRAHDGFLTVDSFPEKGTTFSLYLPLKSLASEEPSAGEEQPEIENRASRKSSESILVVEDEPGLRTLVEKMLLQLGYSVECCESGKSALEICSSKHFDLIVTDQMMPEMSGIELANALKEQNQGVKILVMSGSILDLPEQARTSVLLTKPFDLDALSVSVRQALSE